MDTKNDRKDDKTRWELMPLDCLEDIARVYTEGAKKYDDNTWQNLENGYERYKGALLRHLYAANLAAQMTEIILGNNIVRK